MSRSDVRVAAIHLPALWCELASSPSAHGPLGVVQVEEGEGKKEIESRKVLAAVNEAALRYGVRPGQTVAEAHALVHGLTICGVTKRAVREALGRVAEVALGFSPRVGIELGKVQVWDDTVWVDVTGASHLMGGEAAMLGEMSLRISALGHRVRIALAGGPLLARAFAVHVHAQKTVVAPQDEKRMMQALPLEALPLAREVVTWLGRLGIFNVGDLAKLPTATASARLGDQARAALDLAQGVDETPLSTYEPPRAPCEETSWDEPVFTTPPLLFALRGLVAHLGARLTGRGEAASCLVLFAPYDRSIARLRGHDEKGVSIRLDLPTPLAREEDLFRVLKSKLERVELNAPVKGLSITAALLTRAHAMQLTLGGDVSPATDPKALAVLLAEISAEIGSGKLGILRLAAEHPPESRTVLVPFTGYELPQPQEPLVLEESEGALVSQFPTRLLPHPVLLEKNPRTGDTLPLGRQLFVVQGRSHPTRIDQVKWWTASPVSRDYARLSLVSAGKTVEAWVYTDRVTQATYLTGYYD
jgi:protein ImuB